MRHCERDAVPTRVANAPVLHGKAVERVGTELVKAFQLLGHQPADDEGALPTPGDGSVAASLPRAQDEEPLEVKVPLMQVWTHLRLMNVKRPANTPR